MKKRHSSLLLVIGIALLTLSGCSSVNKTMREPNVLLNLNKSDFTLSDQVSASASSVKVFGIDWERLFTTSKSGAVRGSASLSVNTINIPVIGGTIYPERTINYSLYELMNENPGYDVVFYPQYETKIQKPVLGLGFIIKITNVKTTARLGKLNN